MASFSQSWWAFFFWYTIVFPIAVGILYWPPIMSAWEWFGDRKGLATGLIIGGFGFGVFIFSFITTAIANPENVAEVEDPVSGYKYFGPEVADRVPKMYQICVVIWSCLLTTGIILI